VPSKTPTPTAFPTSTPTNTPIPTDTPTWTPKPTKPPPTTTFTDVPRPTNTPEQLKFNVVWTSPSTDYVAGYNGEWRTDGWTNHHLEGGTITLGRDPDLGTVLISRITQDTGANPARVYTDMGVHPDNVIRGDVISIKFGLKTHNYMPTKGGWADLISTGCFTKAVNKEDNWGSLVNLDYDTDGRPFLNAKGYYKQDSYAWSQPGKLLTPDVAHVIEIRIFSKDKKARYYLDGAFQSQVDLDPLFPEINLWSFHAGAYGEKLPIGAEIMNGPITISTASLPK
jgi:hypothetical protein